MVACFAFACLAAIAIFVSLFNATKNSASATNQPALQSTSTSPTPPFSPRSVSAPHSAAQVSSDIRPTNEANQPGDAAINLPNTGASRTTPARELPKTSPTETDVTAITKTTASQPITKKLSSEMAVAVPFSTANMRRSDAVRKVIETMPHPVELDSDADRILLGSNWVSDELRDISAATALAILLRPAGLSLSRKAGIGERTEFKISASNEEPWPVGHPPPDQWGGSIPSLAQRMPLVEIVEQPLSAPLKAIQSRLRVPILIDHYALQERGASYVSTMVSSVGRDVSYDETLNELLGNAGLQYEVRVDERGSAFLWITTSVDAVPKQPVIKTGRFRPRFPPRPNGQQK
jgi:hypothetical protein